MSELLGLMKSVSASKYENDASALPEKTRDFIEMITFASPDEILESLRVVLSEDWISVPIWARNLAYRLACLQCPGDPQLLREAAVDLLSFGPDWDEIAEELKGRAEQLETR
ncbi:MAG: hypothetical protein ACRDOI_40720 [Trebonia sp.]